MGVYTPLRDYFPGMGEAVADRTVNRMIFTEGQREALPELLKLNPNDPRFKAWWRAANLSCYPFTISQQAPFQAADPILRKETWKDVGVRVAKGNALLAGARYTYKEFRSLRDRLWEGSILLSGRHLQHGDEWQKDRPMEVFTNCSTASATFLLFQLLLNGSGVGRAYDDDMMVVDLSEMPTVYVAIDKSYPDRFKTEQRWDGSKMADVPMIGEDVNTMEWFDRQIHAGYLASEDKVVRHRVEDSREGWARAFELIEVMAFQKKSDHVLILDFSEVRPHGSPIAGMQMRPSSGPAAVMRAIQKIAAIKFLGLEPWQAAMYADHYAAECVLVGGARRAARMATKTWRDKGIFKFIKIKSEGGLWSSNNSVTIDQEFRDACTKVSALMAQFYNGENPADDVDDRLAVFLKHGEITELEAHAWKVLIELSKASYFDGTGEPGIINQDKLTAKNEGIEAYVDGLYASGRGQLMEETLPMMRELARRVLSARYTMITNPCGEISLLMLGGYCVIADVVPLHAETDDDAEDAFRLATRALIRTNLMNSLYKREVDRTNRIGVGFTGFHEWAYDRFGFTWHDIVDEEKSKEMWLTLSRFKRAIKEEAAAYAKELGVTVPHTDTTVKPAGTTSKLFGLSEGAHLPALRWMLRWVQFRNDDPLIEEYRAKGYPVRALTTYDGTTIVGFPTEPTICSMDGGEWVVTAGEATPEEQYQYLRLIEKYWVTGVEEDGVTPLTESGNQVSYTLKYRYDEVSFEKFLSTLIDGQFSIRCCSVMPQADTSKYEYQPEEEISKAEYLRLKAIIDSKAAGDEVIEEGFDMDTLQCASGACPI